MCCTLADTVSLSSLFFVVTFFLCPVYICTHFLLETGLFIGTAGDAYQEIY